MPGIPTVLFPSVSASPEDCWHLHGVANGHTVCTSFSFSPALVSSRKFSVYGITLDFCLKSPDRVKF